MNRICGDFLVHLSYTENNVYTPVLDALSVIHGWIIGRTKGC